MIRTSVLTVLGLALTSAAALAQSNAPPPPSSNPDSQYDDRYDDRSNPPPAQDQRQTAEDRRSRDIFCRRDAAARTGYVTPGQAASHEQANGTILGTLGGAAVGALIGGAAGNAGTGAAIGAGAGLLGGTAVGADNARRAAADVERDYANAYYACMGEARYDTEDGPDYSYSAPPPPPVAYYPPPPPPVYYGYGPYAYPYYPYYGPSVGFSFRFGGGGWGHRGWHH